MANPIKVAKSAMAAGARGAKNKAPKAAAKVMPAASGFPRGSMDDLIYQLTIGGKAGDQMLISQLQQLAGTNPASVQKLKKFGLHNPATLPVPKTPAATASAGSGHGRKALKLGVGMGALGAGVYAANRMIPPGAFGQQFEPMKPSPSHSTGGYKAAGMVNAAPDPDEVTDALPDELEVETEMPKVAAPPVRRSGSGGGMRSRPPSKGLTGVNGVSGLDLSGVFGPSPEWDQTLSSVDDSIQSAQGTLDKFNAPQEEKGGGGFGDLMQKIGPLIAALLMGRMMK